MPRVSLLDFDADKHRGLWIAGPRERTPRTHMRRLTAIHSIRERLLRTRDGSVTDVAVANAHSLARFDDVRFQGDGVNLRRAGVIIDSGQDGTPLEFEVSEPRTGTDAEYLFVAGGGSLIKVDTAGVVTQWGIDPPTGTDWNITVGTGEDSDQVTVADPQEKQIVDSTVVTNWTASDADGTLVGTIVTEDVLTPSGSAVCFSFREAGTADEVQEET